MIATRRPALSDNPGPLPPFPAAGREQIWFFFFFVFQSPELKLRQQRGQSYKHSSATLQEWGHAEYSTYFLMVSPTPHDPFQNLSQCLCTKQMLNTCLMNWIWEEFGEEFKGCLTTPLSLGSCPYPWRPQMKGLRPSHQCLYVGSQTSPVGSGSQWVNEKGAIFFSWSLSSLITSTVKWQLHT